MSTMLEQAIVDAEALKEAAVKNAETLVLEKYSNEIKGAVETLLEQEEGIDPMAEMGGMEEGPMMAEEPAEEEPSVMENIPLAVTTEDDDQVEIPLDALYEQITKLSETVRRDGDFIDDPELFEYNLVDEELYEEDTLGELSGIPAEENYEAGIDDPDAEDFDDDYSDLSEYLDEDYDISDEVVEEIAEVLKVDLAGANPTGWLRTPQKVIEIAEEEILALEQDSEVREQRAALMKAAKKLESVNEAVSHENNKLQKSLNKAKEHMIKLRDTVLVLDEKLQESNLNNAKLLYQNKALNSNSMNERQKHKLVESISNAESIEEAKVIFETLNNTVGSTSRKSQPNSLSEAVQKNSSMILSSREKKPASQKSDPAFNRWKFLAGIDKN